MQWFYIDVFNVQISEIKCNVNASYSVLFIYSELFKKSLHLNYMNITHCYFLKVTALRL